MAEVAAMDAITSTGMQPEGSPRDLRFGVVIRPPYMERIDTQFRCDQIEAVQEASLAHLAASVSIVRRGNFIGVVADDAKTARQAATDLEIKWSSSDGFDQATQHVLTERTSPQTRTYTWPGRLPRGDWQYIVADSRNGGVSIWGDIRTPAALRNDLAMLCECAPAAVRITASQNEGAIRGIEDDAAADAALMSLLVQAPVAVMPDAEGAHAPNLLGDACRIDWHATSAAGKMRDVAEVRHGSAGRIPVLALLLARKPDGTTRPEKPVSSHPMAAGPYDFEDYRRVIPDPPTDVVWDSPDNARLPALFARESFMDEMAREAGADPISWRRRHLRDTRHQKLLDAVSRAAHSNAPPPNDADSNRLHGRGIACDFSPRHESSARSVWIIDLEVDRATGAIELTRLLVGEDGGKVDDNAALRSSLEQVLLGQDDGLLNSVASESSDWETNRQSLPAVETVSLPAIRDNDDGSRDLTILAPQRVAPGIAAAANAIFDATGIRMRKPPFDAPRMRSVMASQGLLQHDGTQQQPSSRRWPRWAFLGAATIIGAGITLINPFRQALPEQDSISARALYSQSAIERGRMVAAAGDCAVCHTTEEGATNAGGLAFETPFGTLYSTNITPDPDTGIGSWSYTAFERAMREGISRDGSHLYPAFPYTAYAKLSDADMHALYAYLMSREAVHQTAPRNQLKFPFSYRPLMTVWNALFLRPGQFKPEPSKNALFNRGKYLTEGLGHCAACHSPRNAMGAEKKGAAHFAGGVVDGWDAPALNQLSAAPLAWTEQDLYDYLRTGQSQRHGVASGPMQPVIDEMAKLSNWDIRAIAHYIASYSATSATRATAASKAPASRQRQLPMYEGEALYDKACASCHEASPIRRFDQASIDLALNTNLHAKSPNNMLQVIVNGIDGHRNIPGMPAFGDNLSDSQIVALTRYMRDRFAPGMPEWQNIARQLREIRDSTKNQTH